MRREVAGDKGRRSGRKVVWKFEFENSKWGPGLPVIMKVHLSRQGNRIYIFLNSLFPKVLLLLNIWYVEGWQLDIGCLVKFEFQINNEYFLSVSVCPKYCTAHLYTKNVFIVYLKLKFN